MFSLYATPIHRHAELTRKIRSTPCFGRPATEGSVLPELVTDAAADAAAGEDDTNPDAWTGNPAILERLLSLTPNALLATTR